MRLELLGMGLFGFGYLCPLALYWVFRESVSALDIYWLMNCFLGFILIAGLLEGI